MALLTLEQVAERFHVSRRTLQDFLRSHPGDPPYFRTLGRRKLFSEADLSRLWEALPCRSNSSRHAKAKARTGRSGAPISRSMWTEAAELVGRPLLYSNSETSKVGSNVVSIQRSQSKREPQPS